MLNSGIRAISLEESAPSSVTVGETGGQQEGGRGSRRKGEVKMVKCTAANSKMRIVSQKRDDPEGSVDTR